MRFQLTTDYAIRIIGYLHRHPGELVTAQEVADNVGVTYQIFMKVSNQLKKAGLVKTTRGCLGGYSLGKRGSEISLFEIVMIMEGEICINRCLAEDGYCSGHFTATCPVHCALGGLQATILDTLKSVYISDMWKEADKSFDEIAAKERVVS